MSVARPDPDCYRAHTRPLSPRRRAWSDQRPRDRQAWFLWRLAMANLWGGQAYLKRDSWTLLTPQVRTWASHGAGLSSSPRARSGMARSNESWPWPTFGESRHRQRTRPASGSTLWLESGTPRFEWNLGHSRSNDAGTTAAGP